MAKEKAYKNGVKIVYMTKMGKTFGERLKHCLQVLLGLDVKLTSDISPEDLICLKEKKTVVRKKE